MTWSVHRRLARYGWSWLFPLGLTFLLYWRTLSLPFFWDDIPNFDFATTRTITQIWTDVSGFPYYRPALFTFWKIALAALPPAPTFLLHAVVIVTHALNGVLVGYLARQLVPRASTSSTDDWFSGTVAAVLFISFPYSVVPLSHVAAFFHVVVTLLTLSASLAALKFIQARQRRWLLSAFLLTTLAPYAHEAGVVAGAIVSLTLVYSQVPLTRSDKWRLGLFPLLSAAFFPIWLAIPKSNAQGLAWVGWESLGQSLTLFVQGPTYPLQLLARPLIEQLGWSDLQAVWAAALPLLALVIAAVGIGRKWTGIVWSVGWFGLSIAPSVVALPFSYIVTSMRLRYYSAPGAALLWATVIAMLTARLPTPRWRYLAASGLTLAGLIYPLSFIQKEITLHQFALSPIWQVADVVRRYPNERHLVINLMDWVASARASYALGHEGVEVMASYVSPTQIATINSGLRAHVEDAVFPPVQTAMDQHYYALHGEVFDWGTLGTHAPNYDRVWLMTYSDRGITLKEAGTVINQSDGLPSAYLANFEQKVYLVDGSHQLESGDMMVTLHWLYAGPDPDATIFRHVFDCAENVLGLGDGHALERVLPFYTLTPGAVVRDVRRIPLEAHSPDGCYTVETGLFRADGSRVRAYASDGSEFENAVVPLRP